MIIIIFLILAAGVAVVVLAVTAVTAACGLIVLLPFLICGGWLAIWAFMWFWQRFALWCWLFGTRCAEENILPTNFDLTQEQTK